MAGILVQCLENIKGVLYSRIETMQTGMFNCSGEYFSWVQDEVGVEEPLDCALDADAFGRELER